MNSDPVDVERPLRRALVRADQGKSLDVDDISALLNADGAGLARLQAIARRVRDLGLESAGRPDVVTYSPKVFIPLTRLCRDRCHYCTFVTVPGQLARAGQAPYLTRSEVLEIARAGAAAGCTEALFTLGDRPEDRWPEAKQWLTEAGYDSTVEYLRAMAIAVLEETGLLPHLNPGILTWRELTRLKPVAPSMGLMLETTATRLFTEPGQAHFGSPDKDPAVRIRMLEDAGRLNVPFTSGLLVGIGESVRERAESLLELRRQARMYGAIQEVIIQNFRAKADTAMRYAADLPLPAYLAAIATARVVLGSRVRIQAPPNLVDLVHCRELLDSGVDDFGGISPVTPDHVNPERPWPEIAALAEVCAEAGLDLRARLTAHPGYLDEPWLDPRLRAHVEALRGPDGLANGAPAAGLPWQEPDGGWNSRGRTQLDTEIDTTGRAGDRRGDFDDVYGDWSALRASATSYEVVAIGATSYDVRRAAPVARLDSGVAAALRAAEGDPAGLSAAHALALITAPEGPELDAVCALADHLRREAVGETVTYVVNRNINFTNVCYTGCRFCAFAQRRTDPDAYTLSLAEIGARAQAAERLGATEVCLQGGIDPELPATAYFDISHAVKAAAPTLHVHAFSPMEIVNGVARTGLSLVEFLEAVREAGVDSLPGTAAEILDDEIRWILTKGKLPAADWIEVVTTAHRLGIPTTSTMMYGHVDHPRHWVAHLHTLARIQRETGGFTEFVPLPFVHHSSPIYLAGVARPGPTARDNLAVHAVARILLHGLIDNIQCSWVKVGTDGAVGLLGAGVNDLGGTLMEETISRMAGSQHGSRREISELQQMAARAGRPARQRTTTYGSPANREERSA